LEAVSSAGDPNIDSADGHPIAYVTILHKSQEFENPPVFLNEDSAPSVDDPFITQNVSEWMEITKQVATGNRSRVLEDGADKMNSSDEDDLDMKPDELTGMYTSEMDPKNGPVKLSQSQVATQKAAAHALKAQKSPPRSQSPLETGSSDDDDPSGSQMIWSSSKGIFRKDKRWVDPNARKALPAPAPQKALPAPELKALPAPDATAIGPTKGDACGNPVMGCSPVPQKSRPPQSQKALPAPERQPTPVSSDTEDQSEMTEDQKRFSRFGKKKTTASQRASPGDPTKEAQASHPMQTRRQEASRAGGLRGVVGSGLTGHVCHLWSPSSKPGS
jgi:hypothetical protein